MWEAGAFKEEIQPCQEDAGIRDIDSELCIFFYFLSFRENQLPALTVHFISFTKCTGRADGEVRRKSCKCESKPQVLTVHWQLLWQATLFNATIDALYSGEGVQGIWEYIQDLTFSQHKLDRVPIILSDLALGEAKIIFWQISPRILEVRLKWHPLMCEWQKGTMRCFEAHAEPLLQLFSFSCCFYWDRPLNNNE